MGADAVDGKSHLEWAVEYEDHIFLDPEELSLLIVSEERAQDLSTTQVYPCLSRQLVQEPSGKPSRLTCSIRARALPPGTPDSLEISPHSALNASPLVM